MSGKPEKVVIEKVIGFKLPDSTHSHTPKDAILYALGIGFSEDPLNVHPSTRCDTSSRTPTQRRDAGSVAFPGHHSIDYGCTVVGIVFSVNPLNGAV